MSIDHKGYLTVRRLENEHRSNEESAEDIRENT
jgi:hypothetical protein